MLDANPDTLSDRLSGFVHKLEAEARRRVDRRINVERRWIEDLRQYHGIYDPEIDAKLKAAKTSRVFINTTATKTEAMEARLWDLLFPTDDRNWGIEPTPVPELTEQAEAALKKVDDAKAQGDLQQQIMQAAAAEGNVEGAAQAEAAMRQAEEEENLAQAAADDLQDRMAEAKRRSDLMQEEIEDQLVTSRYATEARDMIGDACRIGMGVLKGPVVGERRKQRWEIGANGVVLVEMPDEMPAVYRVDPWGFFPDPDVPRIEDNDGFYERHLLSKQQLRKLAKQEGVDENVVRGLLKAGPSQDAAPFYLTELASLTGQNESSIKDRYHVWEYRGPVEAEDMLLLAVAFEDEGMAADMEEVDPLQEVTAKVLYCQGKVLSFALHPLDSGEPIYSTFTIRRDEGSPFGFGVPYIMRHPQTVLNSAVRMMMDNSGLGAGPQFLIDKSLVQPEDGQWTLAPRKVWQIDSSAQAQKGGTPFQTFHIETHQNELAAIIALAAQMTDEVTAMPQIAQGEQGSGVTKTAQGMALLMNAANVTFRRVVKMFDDDVTVPVIRRLYHWNMQFSPKEEIKGDYEVQARGSSVLLVREMQANNLMLLATMFGDHPVFGQMLKHPQLFRQIIRAHMIAADEIVKTDREYKSDLAKAQEEGDPQAQAMQADFQLRERELELRDRELTAKVEIANQEADTRRYVADRGYEATMSKLAEALNMSRDQLALKMETEDRKNQSSERKLAVEVAMKQQTGVSAGGSV